MSAPQEDEGSSEISVLLIAVTFLAPASAAIFSKSVNTEGKWISILNSFASGVFVGIAFFHILTESFADLLELQKPGEEDDENVLKHLCAYVLVGFTMMLWLDKLWFSKYHEHSHGAHSHSVSPSTSSDVTIAEFNAVSASKSDDIEVDGKLRRKRAIALGTLVAFSFHSFLEGIALGAETPDLEMIGLIAVFSFHKALDGLAVMIPLSRCRFSAKLFWSIVFAFCSITPIGILSAMGLLRGGGPLKQYAGVVEGISGGVFIYISLFHILAEELEKNEMMMMKLFAFTSAIFVMFVIGG